MNSKNLTLTAVLAIAISLAACSPSSPTEVTLSEISGLWNSSEKTAAGEDIIYTRIASNGDIIEYDYDGDEADKGLDCYQVNTGTARPLGNNRFLVDADMYKDVDFEVELEILDAGNALKIYFMDDSDTLRSQIWTRVGDQTLLDSEPTCTAQ